MERPNWKLFFNQENTSISYVKGQISRICGDTRNFRARILEWIGSRRYRVYSDKETDRILEEMFDTGIKNSDRFLLEDPFRRKIF